MLAKFPSEASIAARGVTTWSPGTLASRALTASTIPRPIRSPCGGARQVAEGEDGELADSGDSRHGQARAQDQVGGAGDQDSRQDRRRRLPASGRRRVRRGARSGHRDEHGLELEARVAGVAQPASGVLLEASAQQLAHARGNPRRENRPVRLVLEDRGDRVGDRLAREGPASRQHLEEDAAERPDVGAPVGLLAARLLGAHELRSADDVAGPSSRP